MIDMSGLLATGIAFSVVMISPGPANVANATLAMANGRAGSVRFALGLGTGLSIWGLVAATGLGTVLQTSIVLLSLLKGIGGLYLLWLAWTSARAAIQPEATNGTVLADSGNWFLRGLLFNLSNPKSVLAWMAALSMGVSPGDGAGAMVLAFALCAVLGYANNLGHSLIFSTCGMMAAYRRARRWIDGTVSGLFAFAGIGLIRSAFSR